jgi:hypothetical protein
MFSPLSGISSSSSKAFEMGGRTGFEEGGGATCLFDGGGSTRSGTMSGTCA